MTTIRLTERSEHQKLPAESVMQKKKKKKALFYPVRMQHLNARGKSHRLTKDSEAVSVVAA